MDSGNSNPFHRKEKFSTVTKSTENSSNEVNQIVQETPKTSPIDTEEGFHDPFQSDPRGYNQPLLSYAEAAALRASDTGDMWAIVQKTCTDDGNWALNTVKNRRRWKTIRLFVSSTFRDFHAEREVLVKEVNIL